MYTANQHTKTYKVHKLEEWGKKISTISFILQDVLQFVFQRGILQQFLYKHCNTGHLIPLKGKIKETILIN